MTPLNFGLRPMGRMARRGVSADLFTLSATTTSPGETVTLRKLTPSGTDCVVDWGDTSETTILDGNTAATPHVYVASGVYVVTITEHESIVYLDLNDGRVSCDAGEIGKLTSMATLRLINLPNLIVGAGEIGGLTSLGNMYMLNASSVTIGAGEIGGLTSLNYLYVNGVSSLTVSAGEVGNLTLLTQLTLYNLPNLTTSAGEISNLTLLTKLLLQNIPNLTTSAGEVGGLTLLTNLTLYNLPNLTAGSGEIGNLTLLTYLYLRTLAGLAHQTGMANLLKITTMSYRNNLTQPQVDSTLSQMYSAFPARTGVNGTITLSGTNVAPSGILQAQCPPTTGKENAYELVNDSCGVSSNHWAAVVINA